MWSGIKEGFQAEHGQNRKHPLFSRSSFPTPLLPKPSLLTRLISCCTPKTQTLIDILGEIFHDPAAASAYSATNTEWYVAKGWDTISLHTAANIATTYTVVHNPCSPMLSVPTQLYTLQPQWTGCLPGLSAFFDPIYTLTSAGSTGLVPHTTGAPAVPGAVPTATPPKPGEPRSLLHLCRLLRPQRPTPITRISHHRLRTPILQVHIPTPQLQLQPQPAPSAYIIASQTLAAGGRGITLGRHTCGLQPAGQSTATDGTKTTPLASFLASPFAAVSLSQTGGKAQETGGAGSSGSGRGGRSSAGGAGGSGNGNGNGNGGIGHVFDPRILNPGS
jgi:uncharacterized membrane protein YgcG